MAAKKGKAKQKVTEFADQLENVFLAGLGALSNAQKMGADTFDTLVKQGEKFRKQTTKRTEALIDDVQDAIREMGDDAQEKAEGLFDQVRDRTKLEKLQDVFDSRVADAMDRLKVPTKKDVDAINRKLNKILKTLEEKEKPAPVKKRTTTKKKTASVKKAPVKKTEAKAVVAAPVAEPAKKPEGKAA